MQYMIAKMADGTRIPFIVKDAQDAIRKDASLRRTMKERYLGYSLRATGHLIPASNDGARAISAA